MLNQQRTSVPLTCPSGHPLRCRVGVMIEMVANRPALSIDVSRVQEPAIALDEIDCAHSCLHAGVDDDTQRRVLAVVAEWLTSAQYETIAIAACRSCGCTDAAACEGSCTWIEPNLCSSCAALGAHS
jgi:hypothetical protein